MDTQQHQHDTALVEGRSHYADLALTGRHAWINGDTGMVDINDEDGETITTLTPAEALALVAHVNTYRTDLQAAAGRIAKQEAWKAGAEHIAQLIARGTEVRGMEVTYFRSDFSSQVAVVTVGSSEDVTAWAEVWECVVETDEHTWESGMRRVQAWASIGNVVIEHTLHEDTTAKSAVA